MSRAIPTTLSGMAARKRPPRKRSAKAKAKPAAFDFAAAADQIVVWVLQGLSHGAIADRLEGASRQAVTGWLMRPEQRLRVEMARSELAQETARMALSTQKPMLAFLSRTMTDEQQPMIHRLGAARILSQSFSLQQLTDAMHHTADAIETTATEELTDRVAEFKRRALSIEAQEAGGGKPHLRAVGDEEAEGDSDG